MYFPSPRWLRPHIDVITVSHCHQLLGRKAQLATARAPGWSYRRGTPPARLDLLHRRGHVHRHRAVFGFASAPWGLESCPAAHHLHHVRVAISASKAVQLSFWISPPSPRRPQSPRRFLRFPLPVAAGNHRHRLRFAQPVRQHNRPRTIWSAWRVSTPSRIVKSTVSSTWRTSPSAGAKPHRQRISGLRNRSARLSNILAEFPHSSLVSHRTCQSAVAEACRRKESSVFSRLATPAMDSGQMPWCY